MKKAPKAKKQIPICSFCGKTSEEVDGIIEGPGVNICFACACVCKAITDRKRAETDRERAEAKLIDVTPEPNTSSQAEISALKLSVAVLTLRLDRIAGIVDDSLSRLIKNKRLAPK
jgi:hypothetical protein